MMMLDSNNKDPKGAWGRVIDWGKAVFGLVTKLTAINRRLTDSLNAQRRLLKILVEMAGTIPNLDERKEIVKKLAELNDDFIDATFKREHEFLNPLTKEELARIEGYYSHYKNGGWFNESEAKDFVVLAQKLEEDMNKGPDIDVGSVVLAGVAGLILGIVIATASKNG
jgi:hypothetical protein